MAAMGYVYLKLACGWVLLALIIHVVKVESQAREGDIRFVDGTDPSEGRIEIFHSNHWGTICDDGWSSNDAVVACRQLGYTGYASSRCCAAYGQGARDSTIWLRYVSCNGNEDLLVDCGNYGWGGHYYCDHYEDAGLSCSGGTNEVRLQGGHGELDGRVEVFVNGRWGTVCADEWDVIDANIVCQQLRFTAADEIYNVTSDEWPAMGNVACSGREEYLAECSHSGWGYFDEDHTCEQGAAAVKCRFDFGSDQIRLIGGGSNEGRVEVLFENEWGTICDDHWDLNEGKVACRQMGFQAVISVTTGASYGEGSGPIWLDDLGCTGNETNLSECEHDGWGEVGRCGHQEDAGVVCSLSQEDDVRLVGGSSNSEGRVEIYHDGSWGTICNIGWEEQNTLVTCRHLGFQSHGGLADPGAFGVGSGVPIWLKDVTCGGSENDLSECGHANWGNTTQCTHDHDVGITCLEASNKIRLVGGETSREGNVEILHNGRWGTICPDDWDVNEVTVVCRYLGFSGEGAVLNRAELERPRGPIWMGGLNCSGYETNLAECGHPGWEKHGCNYAVQAGVICHVAREGDVRLVDEIEDNPFEWDYSSWYHDPTYHEDSRSKHVIAAGRVEIYHGGAWGTICNRGWDLHDSSVVCRQLGFSKVIDITSAYAAGRNEVLLADVDCSGSESSLLKCDFSGWGNTACNHTQDVGIICSEVDRTPPVIYNCPQNINVTVEVGDVSKPVFWTEPWAADDSGITTLLTNSHSPGYTFPDGTTIVSYLFINPANLIAGCKFEVNGIPVDSTPPNIIRCPSDIYFPVYNRTSSVSVSWTEPSAFDLSNVTLVSSSETSGTSFPVGATAVTYDFTDSFGNHAYCNFTVNVFNVGSAQTPNNPGNQPTVVNCPNDIVTNVEIGTQGTAVSWQAPWVHGGDGTNGTILAQTHTSGNVFPAGNTTVTYIFTDTFGQIIPCTFIVTGIAVDTTPPENYLCPGNQTIQIEFGSNSTTVDWIEPFATDNSGIITTSRTHGPGAAFSPGRTRVQYVFIDGEGNSNTCNFYVDVTEVDTTPPNIENCRQYVTKSRELGDPLPLVSWEIPTATDESGSVTVTSTHSPNSPFNVGITTVVYTFEDSSHNVASCVIEVNVKQVDTRAPTVQNCPSNISKTMELGTSGTTVTWDEPTGTDESGVANMLLRSHRPGATFASGTSIVTYLFADSSGNLATCVFAVTIRTVDTRPPMIIQCPNNIETNAPRDGKLIWWTRPTAYDASESVAMNASGERGGPGTGFPLGISTVHYDFTDTAGNTASCSFDIIIRGPFQIQYCPNNIRRTIELGNYTTSVTWTEPTAAASDSNAPRPRLLHKSHSSGAYFPVGRTDVSYVFFDSSNNIDSCLFAVIISTVDTTPPNILQCPPDIERIATSHTAGTAVTWTEPHAMDYSSVTRTRTHTSGSVFRIGTTRVIYTFTDAQNNQATCKFNITIDPVETVFFEVSNCPNDITDSLEVGTQHKPITWDEPETTDPNGDVTLNSQSHRSGDAFEVGKTTVTYEFRNEAGHAIDCSFKIIINSVDTTAPVIPNCPRDMHTVVEKGTRGKSVSWEEPTATDLSGTVIRLARTHIPGGLFYPGLTAVTYLFADVSHNTASCTFQVNTRSVDTLPPVVASCPSDITRTIAPGLQSTSVSWKKPEAIDLPGELLSITRSHAPGDSFPIGSTRVTYEFSDSAQNSATCTFNITVVAGKNATPRITNCPDDITVDVTDSQVCQASWEEPQPEGTSGDLSLFLKTHLPGTTVPVGSTVVTYIFKDDNNNFATCRFTVTCSMVISSKQTQPDKLEFRISIAGLIVASAVAVCLLLCVVIIIWRRRERSIKHSEFNENFDPHGATVENPSFAYDVKGMGTKAETDTEI